MDAVRRLKVIAAVGALALSAVPAQVFGASRPDAELSVRVADSGGRGLAGRDIVVSTRWSSKADWQKHGRAVGRNVRTDTSGRANVQIRLTDAERASVRANNDWLNISLVVLDGAGNPTNFVATSRYLGGKADQIAQTRFLPHQGAIAVTTNGHQSATDGVRPALVSCTYYWEISSYPDGYVQIGELHRDKALTKAKFTYGETADSNIDAAASSNSGATWQVTGSFHIGSVRSAAVSASATTDNYHWALRSQFMFGLARLYKDCVGGPTHAWTGSEEIEPLAWAGGGMTLSNPVAQLARNAAYSQTYGPNTGWSRTTSKLTKWGGAITIMGAKLGAQSGASSEVKIEYETGSRATYYIYGNNAKPATSSRVFQQTP